MVATQEARSYPFTPSEHLKKAYSNENLATALFLLNIPCCDWVITIIFYSALHYFYSKLPVSSVQSTHGELIIEIEKRYSKDDEIYLAFNSLKNRSENVRYYPHMAKKDKDDREICLHMFEHLQTIKKKLKIKKKNLILKY